MAAVVGDINRIGTIQIGKVQGFEDKKSANITPIPFPGKDSGEAQGIDTLGVIAYMNITGTLTGDFSTIQNTIYLLKNIADGKQTSALSFYSPFVNSNVTVGPVKLRRQGDIGVLSGASGVTLTTTGKTFDTWGIAAGDYIKNLRTGKVTTIATVAANTLTVADSGEFIAGDAYAVTANIKVKILDINVRWGLPGLNYVDYDLSVMQVKD